MPFKNFARKTCRVLLCAKSAALELPDHSEMGQRDGIANYGRTGLGFQARQGEIIG